VLCLKHMLRLLFCFPGSRVQSTTYYCTPNASALLRLYYFFTRNGRWHFPFGESTIRKKGGGDQSAEYGQWSRSIRRPISRARARGAGGTGARARAQTARAGWPGHAAAGPRSHPSRPDANNSRAALQPADRRGGRGRGAGAGPCRGPPLAPASPSPPRGGPVLESLRRGTGWLTCVP